MVHMVHVTMHETLDAGAMKAAGTRKYALLPILAKWKSQQIRPQTKHHNLHSSRLTTHLHPQILVSLNTHLTTSHYVSFLLRCHPQSSHHVISPAFLGFFPPFFDLGVSDFSTFGPEHKNLSKKHIIIIF